MCTVTYIPDRDDNGFILTSNRDEKELRPTIPPGVSGYNGINIAFPKDLHAGGTWIAINERGRTCCLLNGAFTAHRKQHHHTKSRGKIVKELAASSLEVEDFFNDTDLDHVEPFTMVTVDCFHGQSTSFNEFIWDGRKKHYTALDKTAAHIWSSVTLYDIENCRQRKTWFDNFIAKTGDKISPEKVLTFHAGTHTSDHAVNLIMKREGGLKTVSITQVTGYKHNLLMKYYDLINSENHEIELGLKAEKILDYDLHS